MKLAFSSNAYMHFSAEDTIHKIFNIHFSTKKGGHGLGLSNCRNIIQQHRGELSVDSTPGEGTTFSIVLPRFQPKKRKKSD